MDRGIRLYVSGQLALVTGSWSQNVGLNLLIYEQTGSATTLGLLNFLLFGPMLLVAPMAGAWIVPHKVRPILLAALFANVVVSLVLAFVVAAGGFDTSALLILAVLSGFSSAVEMPARLVLVSGSADRQDLVTNALGLNVLAVNVGRTVGSALGAIVYGAFGAPATFLLFAAGLLAMAGCVTAMPMRRAPEGSYRAGLRRSVGYAIRQPFTAFFLPVVALIALFASSYPTLVPLLSSAEFGDAAKYTGLFLTCGGVGAVLSSVVLSSRAGDAVGRRFVRLVPWVIGMTLGAISLSPNLGSTGLAFVVLGAGITFTNAASSSVMLQHSPAEFRGSVAGLYSMAFAGFLPFGHLLAGWLTDFVGIRHAFAVMALGLLATLGLVHAVHRYAFPDHRAGAS